MCYAMRMAARLEAMGKAKYAGLAKKVNGLPVWTGKINLDEHALTTPLKWKKPRRVFVNSMSDLFHEGVPFEFVDRVFAVMALCPQHTFQVLTKRPERMAEYLNSANRSFRIEGVGWGLIKRPIELAGWPLPNVWLGASCENQEWADERIPHLLACPAAVRFLSCEPLLGPIDLHWLGSLCCEPSGEIHMRDEYPHRANYGPPLDWIIVGGESGPGARPCDVAWIRSIVTRCRGAAVACFVKQLGSHVIRCGQRLYLRDPKGGDPAEWPEVLRIREFPGAAVDGVRLEYVRKSK